MANQKKIASELHLALIGQKQMSLDLYVEALADHEQELKGSLNDDADDALLCVLAHDDEVAMMVIDWGSVQTRGDSVRMTCPP